MTERMVAMPDFREWRPEDMINLLMPSLDRINEVPDVPYVGDINSWKWRNCLVYGQPEFGKTELIRWVAEQVAHKYSPDLLDARNIGCYLPNFIRNPYFARKQVHVLFADDLTGAKLRPEEITKWFRFRHLVKEISHQRVGFILTFLGTHEFFSLQKPLRQGITCFLAKSVPDATNTYDAAWMKRVIGLEGYELLQRQSWEMLAGEKPTKCVFKIMGIVGWMRTPMATRNFLEEWTAPYARVAA